MRVVCLLVAGIVCPAVACTQVEHLRHVDAGSGLGRDTLNITGGEAGAGGTGGADSGAAPGDSGVTGSGGVTSGGGGASGDQGGADAGAGGGGGSRPDAMTEVGSDAAGDGAGGRPCGAPGRAVTLDGSTGYISVPRPVQDSFTLEAWIKTTSVSRTGLDFYLGDPLIYADLLGSANDFGLTMLNSKLAFGVDTAGTTQSTSSINTGAWVHVAATRDAASGQIMVLVNGVSEGTLATSITAPLSAQPTMLIGGNTIDSRFFAGSVDEVRVWNVVRTPAQIRAAMNTTLTGTEPGLVMYWRLDEAAGATAADASGRNATGAFVNGVTRITSDAPVRCN